MTKRLKSIIFAITLVFSLSGCGNDVGSSGDLTLDDISVKDMSGGVYELTTKAVYIPENGASPIGSKIRFTAVYTTTDGASTTRSQQFELPTSGIANFTDTVIQGSEPVFLKLTATIGGLSVTRNASVPAKTAQ